VYIDLAFKTWLQALVGDKNYENLCRGSFGSKVSSHNVEGEHIRKVMKVFDDRKRKFKKQGRDISIWLPGPLSNLNIVGKVDKGLITITR
jgi:hypothetical protein